MGRVVRVTLALEEDTAVHAEAFRSRVTGDPIGWLVIGNAEVAVYGSAAALRRFALDAIRAAEYAEELGGEVFAARREFAAR
jgi:hypothetical protein